MKTDMNRPGVRSRSYARLLQTAGWSAMLLALSTTAANAQIPPPPTHYSVDPRGVDLVSGQFIVSTQEVAIGSGTGALTYGRVRANENWYPTNFGFADCGLSGCDVAVGGATEKFTGSWGSYTPTENTGSTLSLSGGVYTYKTADGVAYRFEYVGNVNDAPGAHALTRRDDPDGLVTTYNYTAQQVCSFYDENNNCTSYLTLARLQSYASTTGYQVHLRYVGNDAQADELAFIQVAEVTGFNLAVDYCAPLAFACTFSRTWPSATYSYDGSSAPFLYELVTDQSGRTTRYKLADLNLLAIQLPGSSIDDVVVNRYGVGGAVESVTDASGTWAYEYAASGSTLTTTAEGPLSQALTAVSDLTIGRALSISDALNNTWSYQYAGGRISRVTSPNGAYTDFTYDGRGNVTQAVQNPTSGSGLSAIVTSAAYPSTCANPVTCNLPTSTTDARGHVTDYTYDAVHGGVLTVTEPAPTSGAARPQTRIAYAAQTAQYKNAAGTIVPAPGTVTLPVSASSCVTGVTCAGTAQEVKSSVVYGSAGGANNLLPTAMTSGNGAGTLVATTTLTYTPNGDVATLDGSLPGANDITTYRYDDARQPIGMISPDPDGGGSLLRRAIRNTYNPRGQVSLAEQGTVTGLTDPNWAAFASLQQQTIDYDAQGRATHQRVQAGGTTYTLTQVSYDAAGRTDCVATRMNPATFAAPPTTVCSTATTGAFGPDHIARYGYDAASRLTSMTSGYGSGAAITESASYSSISLPLTLTDGLGNVSTVEYDGHSRPKKLRYPNPSSSGSSTTDYEEYGYDAASNVITVRTRAGQTFSAVYDALNRQTALDAPAGTDDVAHAYDNLGRPTSASIPSQTTAWAWDALDRLLTETGPLGTMSYQYDLAGRRLRQTWPDAFFVTNTWNLVDEMTGTRHAGTTQIVGYSYDNLGRRIGVTRGNGVTSAYGYDGVSRLTSLSHDVGGTDADITFGYAYNPAGQIVTKTVSNNAYVYGPGTGSTAYANNGLNQVTSIGGSSVGYDANGNITNDTTRAFTFDAANRLTRANGGTSTLSYDALGRLYDYVGTYGGRFIYDGAETVGFATSGTTINTRFIRGPGMDEIVANYVSTGPTPAQYWAADERGSLVNLSSGATGTNTVVNTYDEYGSPAPGNLGRLQYTGQLWMPDFGAYHYKARAYQPGLGRFLQTDPIGYEAGANLYAYVGADPVNWVDPWGLDKTKAAICVGPAMTQGEVLGEITGAGKPSCGSFRVSVGGRGGGFNPGMFGSGGLYSGMPGGEVGAGPSIYTDPQYAPQLAAYRAASERNAIYAEPILMVMPVGPALRGIRAARGATGLFARAGRAACNCFVEGTEVQTPEGFRPIEQVQVGDLVLARDEETGETAYKPVVALIAGSEREIWEVTVETTDTQGQLQREPIGTTDEHPWRTVDGRWVETKDLAAGIELVSSDGDRAVVVSVIKTDRVDPTYNFEVEGFHTYFVGEAGVWVHNACAPSKLVHIFGQTKHQLGRLLSKFGGNQQSAFNAVRSAANAELAAGRLVVGPNGVLPGAGNVLNVGGVPVQLSGGRVINGRVSIGSFSGVIRLP